jgi:predicted DNA-binding transcriptional regulator AlpA
MLQVDANTPLSKRILSQKKTALRLGTDISTLWRWRVKGKGPRFMRFGGQIKYLESDVEAFIAGCVVDPQKDALARNRKRRRQHQHAA